MSFSIYLEQELKYNLRVLLDKDFNIEKLRFKQKQELLKMTRAILKKEGKEDEYIKEIIRAKSFGSI